jgi:hypothetical protein
MAHSRHIAVGLCQSHWSASSDFPGAAVRPRGIVERVLANDPSQGDFELHIRPTRSSSFLVIYDHVLDVRVRAGDSVEPGTVLGLIGNWSPSEGRVELQINRGDLAVCPRDLGTRDFNAAHDAAMAASRDPQDVCLAATVRP